MRVVVTPIARRDVEATLRQTRKLFGQRQVGVYASYIGKAFAMLADDPLRASSQIRDDIKPGARSIRLSVAAGRTKAAAHVIYYRGDRSEGADDVVIVMRLLHEHMDPRRHTLEGE